MMIQSLTYLENKVIHLLRSNPTLSLSEAAKDSCSEMSCILGLWIWESHPDVVMHIVQGSNVLGGNGAHDILAVTQSKVTYLFDPTIWQFFPEAPSMLLGAFSTLENARLFAEEKYAGIWSLREQIECSLYTEDALQKTITLNLFHSTPPMSTALLCIDCIHEILGENGKLAAKGYRAFAQKHDTMNKLAQLQKSVRSEGGLVLHVRLGFQEDYRDLPKKSPLLSGAQSGDILQKNTPSTMFMPEVAPVAEDIVLEKNRISPFFGTDLEAILRAHKVHTLIIAGVATDLAVQSAARDAHDRDFIVQIAAPCCAAASDTEHQNALENMAKFATIL